ncbi:MAG: alpha/beta hydrolase [Cyanobacteria bacterium J06597_1]
MLTGIKAMLVWLAIVAAVRRVLLTLGWIAPILLVGLGISLVGLHQLGLINAWLFPIKQVGIAFIALSLACLTTARILKRVERQHLSNSSSVQSDRATSRNVSSTSKVTSTSAGSKSTWRKRLLTVVVVILVGLNAIAFLCSYYMTHVVEPGSIGIGFPKPRSIRTPAERGLTYSTERIELGNSTWLEAWKIPSQQPTPRGTALLFHGNLGTKGGQLIGPAQSFSELGYESLLVDFQGSGGSSGNAITIGMREAREVQAVLQYARNTDMPAPYVMYGVSMGSAAIMRAIAVLDIDPDAVVIELPFTRLLDAVKSRIEYMHFPSAIVSEAIVFWGGLQHGFNGFAHNPIDYAANIDIPALVLHGEQDKWMSVEDIQAIADNFAGPKQLVISADAGHHQLIGVDRPLWRTSLTNFLYSL